MDAAVCCRLDAVCPCAGFKSWLPMATSAAGNLDGIGCLPNAAHQLAQARLHSPDGGQQTPGLIVDADLDLEVKSPSAMRSATTTARPIGWVTLLVMLQPSPPPSANANNTSTTDTTWFWRSRLTQPGIGVIRQLALQRDQFLHLWRMIVSGGRTRLSSVSTAATVSRSEPCCTASVISAWLPWRLSARRSTRRVRHRTTAPWLTVRPASSQSPGTSFALPWPD